MKTAGLLIVVILLAWSTIPAISGPGNVDEFLEEACDIEIADNPDVIPIGWSQILQQHGVTNTYSDQTLFYVDGRLLSRTEAIRLMGDLDPEKMTVTFRGGQTIVEWTTKGAIGGTPAEVRTAFDTTSGRRSNIRCAWCWALWQRLTGATPVHAQTIFSGPTFVPNVLVSVLLTGGRASAVVRTGSTQIALPGNPVEVSGNRVRLTLSIDTAVAWGIVQPGVRVISGLIARPDAQDAVFDRIPTRDSFQLGVPNYGAIDPKGVVEKFDLNTDGKFDLYYLDTNGNGVIDAVAVDRNADGQITFRAGEGPFLVISGQGRPHEFATVQHEIKGRQHLFLLTNSQVAYLTVVEDKDGNGKIGPGEFSSLYLPLR